MKFNRNSKRNVKYNFKRKMMDFNWNSERNVKYKYMISHQRMLKIQQCNCAMLRRKIWDGNCEMLPKCDEIRKKTYRKPSVSK